MKFYSKDSANEMTMINDVGKLDIRKHMNRTRPLSQTKMKSELIENLILGLRTKYILETQVLCVF